MSAQRDAGETFDRCGPLNNATFDSVRGEVARFKDEAAGLTIQVLSSSAKGYRVRVTRTSLASQGQPDSGFVNGAETVQSQGSLAPPQAPFSAVSFPFGVGWDLDPLTAH